MFTRGFTLVLLTFGLSPVCAQAQVAPRPQQLESGTSVEREIAGGQVHAYQINLAAGQFVRVLVEQKAIDLMLKLAPPDGKQLIEANFTGVGSLESLSAEATSSGEHQLTISAIGPATMVGSYRVRLETKTAASAQDKQRLTAERLLDEARKSYEKGAEALEPAVEKAQQTLPLWRELGDRYWEGVAIHLIGTAKLRLKKYDQAIQAYNQALQIRREVKDRQGESNTLNNLGNAYLALNRNEEAVEFYNQALEIRREVKDRQGEANSLKNLGNAYTNLSRNEKALESLEQALVIYREMKNRASEANTLINLGFACLNLSQSEKAAEYLELALAFHREMKNRADEAFVLSVLGRAYGRLSRYETAIEYYDRSLGIAREVKNAPAEGSALNNLGVAYRRLGRPEKAIEYLELALQIFRESKHRIGEEGVLSELGLASINLGRTDKAIEYYEQALAIAREVKNRADEGNALNNLGVAYNRLRRPEKAIEYLEQALAIGREVKFRLNELEALNNLGIAYSRVGRPEKAIEYLELGLVIARGIHARDVEAESLHGLASAESARGNLPAARNHVEQSLRIAEALRADEITSPEMRASFLANVQSSYQLYTDLLMRQHKAEPTKGFDAFAVETSERQRARSFLDLLSEAHADVREGVDGALLERERSLSRQLNDKAQLLRQAGKPEQADAIQKEISQLETDYERAQAAIRKASPHYTALVRPEPLKLKEIQQQLDPDTLLLEYALGEERSYLWAITRDSLMSYELPKAEIVDQSARQVVELLTARSANRRGESAPQKQDRITQAEAALPAAARGLSQILLGPVAAQLGNKRLVIVADGALQYIPFAMLPEPRPLDFGPGSLSNPVGRVISAKPKGQRPESEDQPLIVKHEVVSLPSASALAIQRSGLAGRQPAPKLLAVIADPVFDRTDTRLTTPSTAPSDKLQPQTLSADDTRSIEHLAETSADKSGVKTIKLVIPRLPFTRQEASQLMALAPKGSSFSAIDFQASRATVLNPALSQYRYLHIATHGWLDAERPGLSALVFSMVDAQGQPQNGFLRANDIYNLKLPAELVVLSACQTGLGKEVKGEGLVGLTRGFMYAGAARVVVSLWNVNDKATADLMTRFYEKMLQQGERPAAALRAAQVEMWKQKQWHSPYYWAAFTMQGEWR